MSGSSLLAVASLQNYYESYERGPFAIRRSRMKMPAVSLVCGLERIFVLSGFQMEFSPHKLPAATTTGATLLAR